MYENIIQINDAFYLVTYNNQIVLIPLILFKEKGEC